MSEHHTIRYQFDPRGYVTTSTEPPKPPIQHHAVKHEAVRYEAVRNPYVQNQFQVQVRAAHFYSSVCTIWTWHPKLFLNLLFNFLEKIYYFTFSVVFWLNRDWPFRDQSLEFCQFPIESYFGRAEYFYVYLVTFIIFLYIYIFED